MNKDIKQSITAATSQQLADVATKDDIIRLEKKIDGLRYRVEVLADDALIENLEEPNGSSHRPAE